jgi:hypothetical protein
MENLRRVDNLQRLHGESQKSLFTETLLRFSTACSRLLRILQGDSGETLKKLFGDSGETIDFWYTLETYPKVYL